MCSFPALSAKQQAWMVSMSSTCCLFKTGYSSFYFFTARDALRWTSHGWHNPSSRTVDALSRWVPHSCGTNAIFLLLLLYLMSEGAHGFYTPPNTIGRDDVYNLLCTI